MRGGEAGPRIRALKYPGLVGTLWVISGFVFLVITFGSSPRNTVHLVLGVLFVAVGAAILRRSRQSQKP